MSDTILVDQDGAIATVTLNRPDKLNALTKPMWERLGRVVGELSGDDDLRCIILRGAGGKAFAAGADISEFESERANREQAKAYGAITHATLAAIGDCRHPTVALIEGVCVGGGLELAAHCDLRICGESSRFGIPIGKLGLVLAYAELEALVNLVGRAVALEILFEGRVFGAREAKEKGLVNRIVADDKVAEEAYATARRIAAGAPLVARWHKRFVRRLGDQAPLSEAELDEGFACFGTEDFVIGYRAFLDKRAPEFKGR